MSPARLKCSRQVGRLTAQAKPVTEIANPESVRISKTNRLTRIANIKLVNRKHKYLRVVIKYGATWQILGKRNYILTFYGADSPIGGEEVCLRK